jgi:GAF domain-containing protein
MAFPDDPGTNSGAAVIHGQNPDRIVREAAARICASLDVEETMRAIADSAQRALAADRATCYVNEIEGQVVSGVYTTETDPRRRAFVEASVGKGQRELPIWRAQLAQADPILVVEDVTRAEAIPQGLHRGLGSGAFLGVLLEHGSVQDSPGRTVLGTLFVTYRRPRRISTEEPPSPAASPTSRPSPWRTRDCTPRRCAACTRPSTRPAPTS